MVPAGGTDLLSAFYFREEGGILYKSNLKVPNCPKLSKL